MQLMMKKQLEIPEFRFQDNTWQEQCICRGLGVSFGPDFKILNFSLLSLKSHNCVQKDFIFVIILKQKSVKLNSHLGYFWGKIWTQFESKNGKNDNFKCFYLKVASTAKQTLLKMCHLRHRLRFFFCFIEKLCSVFEIINYLYF